MYNILGIFKGLNDNAKAEQLNESVKQEPVYEDVEPRGSISEAVKSLESKFATFKEGKADDAKEKLAAKDDWWDSKEDKKSSTRTVKGKAYGGSAQKDAEEKDDLDEGQGPYELYNPKHPKFKANYDKYKAKHPDCTLAEFIAAMKKKEHGVNEGIDDLTDLDAHQFAEPDTDTAVKPASAKQAAADRRRRLQDIEDRRAEKDDWFSGKDAEPNVRIHRAKYQDEPEELDEYTQAEYDQAIGDFKAKGGRTQQLPPGKAKNPISTASRHIAGRGEAGKGKPAGRGAKVTADGKPVVDVYEKAPPGKKAERMVKHIKAGYAKDGKLTKKEKGIAYATAWKAKKAGQVEEGVDFKDIIKNSTPKLSKVKPAKLKESRMLQEGDYFYESVAKSLADHNPGLDTAGPDFRKAVYNEMVAQGIKPNQARNILTIDEDFLGDVATSYGHYCKEKAPVVDSMQELDEIAKLAGLTTEMDSKVPGDSSSPLTHAHDAYCDACDRTHDECICDHEELGEEASAPSVEEVIDLLSKANNRQQAGKAEEAVSFLDQANATQQKLSREDGYEIHSSIEDMIEQISSGSWDDYEVHNGIEDIIMTLEADLDEGVEMEGNEFSGALAAAKASGQKDFEVDGKRYTVKEDVSLTADGADDVVNLIRKLSGLDPVAPEMVAPVAEPEMVAPVAEPEANLRNVDPGEELGLEEDGPRERDIEHLNTPREEQAGPDAAFPDGTDLNRGKKQYKKEYPGDNPTAVKENALWAKYESMISDVKAK